MCCPNIKPDSSCAALNSHSKEAKQQVTYIFKTRRWFCLFLSSLSAPATLLYCHFLHQDFKIHLRWQWTRRGSDDNLKEKTQGPQEMKALLYFMHLPAQCSAHHPGIWAGNVRKSSSQTACKEAEEHMWLVSSAGRGDFFFSFCYLPWIETKPETT